MVYASTAVDLFYSRFHEDLLQSAVLWTSGRIKYGCVLQLVQIQAPISTCFQSCYVAKWRRDWEVMLISQLRNLHGAKALSYRDFLVVFGSDCHVGNSMAPGTQCLNIEDYFWVMWAAVKDQLGLLSYIKAFLIFAVCTWWLLYINLNYFKGPSSHLRS